MEIEADEQPDSWRAVDGGAVVGAARLIRRPDDRRFVYSRSHRAGVRPALLARIAGAVDGELYAVLDEGDEPDPALGFEVNRREVVYRIPVRGQAGSVPPEYTVITAAEADLDRLRELDDALRQDVPGTDGWRSTPEEFAGQLDGPDYDPSTYLVAVEGTGAYVGLVRIWRYQERLGLVAVLPGHRHRGLARGLLARALAVLRDRGVATVSTDVDEANVASTALVRSMGAERTGGFVEWVRRAPR